MPEREIESRQPRLVGGRDVGRGREARLGGNRVGLDHAAAHLRQRQRRRVEHHVERAGDEVLQRLPGAAIGHHREGGADRLLEQQAADMARRADAGIALRDLALIGLEVGDELLQIVRRRRLLADDEKRLRRDQADRLEVVEQVVLERIDGAGRDVGAPLADADRVAVGRRASDAADADGAAGAGRVLHDDRNAEHLAHAFGDEAADHVGRAADTERNHKRDRTRRIALRRGGSAHERCRDGRGDESQLAHDEPLPRTGIPGRSAPACSICLIR